MSSDNQTYSHTQAYLPQNMVYANTALPQMVPLGSPSPIFQAMPCSGPVPQMYMPATLPQLNCGFQAMSLSSVPVGGAMQPMLPMMSSCNSFDSHSSMPTDMSMGLSLPQLCQGDSLDSCPSLPMQRSASPPMCMVPSYSPSYSLIMLPANSNPLPATLVSNVTVTNLAGPVADPTLPQVHDPNLLGYPGSYTQRSRSRSPSVGSDYSCGSDRQRTPEPAGEPSKRDLVNAAFAKLHSMFGGAFDQNGNRGDNILRLKVKTRSALEHIVPFIEFCQKENLIISVSCPISTKKGRQQVRGFLAYIQMKDEKAADRVEELIAEYNACNDSPFNTWHRNPRSTWKIQM